MYIYVYLVLIACIAAYFYLVLYDVDKRIAEVVRAYNVKPVQTDYQMPGGQFTAELERLGAKELVTNQSDAVVLIGDERNKPRVLQFAIEKGYKPPIVQLSPALFNRVKSGQNKYLGMAIAVSTDLKLMNPKHVLLNIIHNPIPQTTSLVIPGIAKIADYFSDALQQVQQVAGSDFVVHAPYVQYGLHMFQRAEDCDTGITGEKIKSQLEALGHQVLSMCPFDFTFLIPSSDHFRELVARSGAAPCWLLTYEGHQVACARLSVGDYRTTLVDCGDRTKLTALSLLKDGVFFSDHVTVFQNIAFARAETQTFPLKERFASDAYFNFLSNAVRNEIEALLGEGDFQNYTPKLFSFAR